VELVSLITGGITSLFTYLLFTTDKIDDELDDHIEEEENESDIIVNDFSTRHVKTYCQTCRKIKSHKEIQKDLYQCTKCKRQVDLRRAS
jgi:acetyl-CoA carboxylase beta subunit